MDTTLLYYKSLMVLLFLVFSGKTLSAQQDYIFNAYQETYQSLNNPVSLNNDLTWDDPYYVIPIGFDFVYNDTIVDTLYLNDFGGTIFFQDLAGFDILNQNEIVHALNVTSIDLMDRGMVSVTESGSPGTLSPISYQLEGQEGERILKVEWKNAGSYEEITTNALSLDFVNIQAWFFEGSNNIELHYGESQISSPALTYQGYPGDVISIGPSDWSFYYPNIESLVTAYLTGDTSDPNLVLVPSEEVDELDTLFLDGPIPNGMVYQFATAPEFVDTTAFEEILSSLDGMDFANLSIFPNPINDAFRLQGITSQTHLNIYDSKGQLLREQDVLPLQNVSMVDFAKGVYLIEVWMNEQWIRRKAIKL